MNIKRFFKMLITNPNSPKGLIIRAEYLEERAEKIDGVNRRSLLLYARILRELASKNYSAEHNKDWIRKNLRGKIK